MVLHISIEMGGEGAAHLFKGKSAAECYACTHADATYLGQVSHVAAVGDTVFVVFGGDRGCTNRVRV